MRVCACDANGRTGRARYGEVSENASVTRA